MICSQKCWMCLIKVSILVGQFWGVCSLCWPFSFTACLPVPENLIILLVLLLGCVSKKVTWYSKSILSIRCCTPDFPVHWLANRQPRGLQAVFGGAAEWVFSIFRRKNWNIQVFLFYTVYSINQLILKKKSIENFQVLFIFAVQCSEIKMDFLVLTWFRWNICLYYTCLQKCFIFC